jgi:hypothetical protein
VSDQEPLRAGQDVVAQLLEASRARRGLSCAGADVAAADIRAACRAAGEADPFGLRLSGARVVGPLDLSAFEVAVPLRFTSCRFTDPVAVEGARLHDLTIAGHRPPGHPTGAALPGLLANGVHIEHDLDLSGMVITGGHRIAAAPGSAASVWLAEAEIGGNLIAAGTHLRPGGGTAMYGDRTRFGGDVRLSHGFRATGEVRLIAAHLTGSLHLIGAHLLPSDGRALDLGGTTVEGSIFLHDSPHTRDRCVVRGRVEMRRATVQGQIYARDAELTAAPSGTPNPYTGEPRGAFLHASGLSVRGGIVAQGDTVVRGGLHLRGAELGRGVRIDGAVWNPGGVALDLAQATLGGGVQLSGASVEGLVSLDNARVDGPVKLEGTTLAEGLDRRCLTAVNLRITGDVRLRGLAALGGSLNFRGAVIAGTFDAEGAFVSNPGDRTVNLHVAQISGNVRLCSGFRSIGLLVLSRAVIEGRLRADGATLTWRPAPGPLDPPAEPNPHGSALDVISAVIRGGITMGWDLTGAVNLTNTVTSSIADRPDRDWPADSHLAGFAYDRFGTVWDAGTRIAWLAAIRPYDPRSWERLAVVLRTAGDRDGADAVLIAQRRHARRVVPSTRRRRAFDLLEDVTVRYGFRPQRAIYLLLALIAAVTVALSLPAVQAQMRASDQNALVFSPAGARPTGGEQDVPGRCGDGKVRCLNPFFYAVDTVVPLIDLHQRATWHPTTEHGGHLLEWWLNLCTILGWVASTVFALSFTRLSRQT